MLTEVSGLCLLAFLPSCVYMFSIPMVDAFRLEFICFAHFFLLCSGHTCKVSNIDEEH